MVYDLLQQVTGRLDEFHSALSVVEISINSLIFSAVPGERCPKRADF
ncbi:hypothetical protein [Rhizobium mongolense]|uniref:Uncharacterized protein n=2 Tax=Rhizobium mongolense TaxID=57676 RepID=A0ABR6IYF2_9HYPH|nr:hypothetical protein [Rhizobium mongolense]MBB4232947.1 hypothetical protein [Rhizobium mongolense]TVZ75095.1 hypothetical protein BCL32_0493 [Rhizobium mongolense USDA 1844]